MGEVISRVEVVSVDMAEVNDNKKNLFRDVLKVSLQYLPNIIHPYLKICPFD